MDEAITIPRLPLSVPSFLTWWEGVTGKGMTKSLQTGAKLATDMLNDAYQDGLDGCTGYPETLDEMAAAFSVGQDEELSKRDRQVFTWMARWRALAYREGRRVAEKEARP